MQMSNAMSSPGPGTPHLLACRMENKSNKKTKNASNLIFLFAKNQNFESPTS